MDTECNDLTVVVTDELLYAGAIMTPHIKENLAAWPTLALTKLSSAARSQHWVKPAHHNPNYSRDSRVLHPYVCNDGSITERNFLSYCLCRNPC